MCADILGHTLERCSVKVEILGFTTRAWGSPGSFGCPKASRASRGA